MSNDKIIREAIHAETWYPSSKIEIQKFLNTKIKKQNAIAAVCPHAGWVYSGKVAGLVFSSIEPKKHYILIGPNHTGLGSRVSIFPDGEWETPLGNLPIFKKAAEMIKNKFKTAELDVSAHLKEHSLEVQAPFIKLTNPDATIVMITLGDYTAETCTALGKAVAETITELNIKNDTLILASTDMSHYVSADEARIKDDLAIRKILELDPDGLLKTVRSNDISMCGSGPVAAVIHAAKDLGALKASLVSYTNSGYITGDFNQVVGYAGFIIS